MAFTQLKSTQVAFLEKYLRGTNRTLTEAQASALFGIQNLRARVCELRDIGLNVKTVPTKTTRRSAYRISRRDVYGSQFKMLG
jgi:Helix-turn-helix domain